MTDDETTRRSILHRVPARRGDAGDDSGGGSNPREGGDAADVGGSAGRGGPFWGSDGTVEHLLEAGVPFGHQTRRWNPKMRRFIFAERSGIYIIDLQKTLRQIQEAQELLRGVILKGENVLFVCTKKQLKNILQAEAQRCGAFYVTERWLGGTLTN